MIQNWIKLIPFFIKKLPITENNHETFDTTDANRIFILQIPAFENIFSTTVTRKVTNITKKICLADKKKQGKRTKKTTENMAFLPNPSNFDFQILPKFLPLRYQKQTTLKIGSFLNVLLFISTILADMNIWKNLLLKCALPLEWN